MLSSKIGAVFWRVRTEHGWLVAERSTLAAARRLCRKYRCSWAGKCKIYRITLSKEAVASHWPPLGNQLTERVPNEEPGFEAMARAHLARFGFGMLRLDREAPILAAKFRDAYCDGFADGQRSIIGGGGP